MTNLVSAEEQRLTEAVLDAYRRLDNYREVAKIIGGNSGEAYRIAHGIYPKTHRRRLELGLPVTKHAPVCLKCGDVHTRKGRCPRIDRILDDYKDLFTAPPAVLMSALNNREVLQKG